MNKNELISHISKCSLNERKYPVVKQLGVKTFLSSLQEPFDAEAVAKKCVANPRSKYYGMNWEEVVKQWTFKAEYKASTGMSLDAYIGYKLNKEYADTKLIQDENTKLQSQQFDMLYDSTLSKLEFVARELWLNYTVSNNTGGIRILGKFDALFSNTKNNLLLVDWKQNDEIPVVNNWGKKFKGPCGHLDDCKYNFFTLQLYAYRYIFEHYDIPISACAIGHITTSSNELKSLAFEYDKGFMKEVFEYCCEQQDN